MRATILITGALLALPLAALAQGGPAQSRAGLSTATATGGITTNNSQPSGGVNAQTGPQSRPAYPSGSTTANPGAAFVAAQPKPATGAAMKPPGTVTKTVSAGGAASKPQSPGVGQAATPPK